jgi:hypothetical protein
MAGIGVISTPEEPKSLPEIECCGNRIHDIVIRTRLPAYCQYL